MNFKCSKCKLPNDKFYTLNNNTGLICKNCVKGTKKSIFNKIINWLTRHLTRYAESIDWIREDK